MTPIGRGHCIIAAKGLIHGKSRLSAHLDPDSLYAFNRGNIERTVTAAKDFFGREQCVVVSPCELTCAVVRKMGVRPLLQARNDGLNAGAQLARDHLRGLHARTLTVLPVDLPYVSNSALRAVLGMSMGPDQAVIVPDTASEGTNLLSFPADAELEFRFGLGSFASHLQQLSHAPLRVHVAKSSVLQVDIDTIEQLQRVQNGEWQAQGFIPVAVSPRNQPRGNHEHIPFHERIPFAT